MDPLCGCGTIPEVASFSFPGAYFIAGDIADIAIKKTAFNFNHTKTSNTEVIKWDSRRLPFITDSIDVLVTDLPFGKRMGKVHYYIQL